MYYFIFIEDIFSAQIFANNVVTEFNTVFGSCGYFNLPIVRSKRQLILSIHCVYTCILVLGLTL